MSLAVSSFPDASFRTPSPENLISDYERALQGTSPRVTRQGCSRSPSPGNHTMPTSPELASHRSATRVHRPQPNLPYISTTSQHPTVACMVIPPTPSIPAVTTKQSIRELGLGGVSFPPIPQISPTRTSSGSPSKYDTERELGGAGFEPRKKRSSEKERKVRALPPVPHPNYGSSSFEKTRTKENTLQPEVVNRARSKSLSPSRFPEQPVRRPPPPLDSLDRDRTRTLSSQSQSQDVGSRPTRPSMTRKIPPTIDTPLPSKYPNAPSRQNNSRPRTASSHGSTHQLHPHSSAFEEKKTSELMVITQEAGSDIWEEVHIIDIIPRLRELRAAV
ncbi:hypothetical protein JAAARDRAFT_56256 [Jaapia argillacea MUCL 33604]|uniref:Uncharacterized protein n=1 Tax=Jaapia argillacea MUCL 33604 TaxID=933084 RepID=A0A067Q2I3_9AGAM|nr:hypothetical protein JAAARDRAFT_56256 [Jaapia argillacea MUCL 33604]